MKNFFVLVLSALSASALTVEGASGVKTPAKPVPTSVKSAPVPAKPAPVPAKPAPVPAKPVIPEKKQPYELWMTAHSKALELARQKKYDEALSLLDEAVKLANRSVWKNYSLYAQAGILTEMKKYGEALSLLKKKLPRDRETVYHKARVRLMCGEIFMLQGKYEEAQQEFAAAAASGINNWISADAELNSGRICELKKNYSGAETHYRKILMDESRLPGLRVKALLSEAEMLKKRKMFAQALEHLAFQGKIEQIPADRLVELAFMRSELQIALKNFKGARQTLEKALQIREKPAPWHAGIFTRLARLAFMDKKFQDARNWIRRAQAIRGHEWGYDKALHRQIDQAVSKANRERIQRERKARLEKERKIRLERQRKKQLEKKRQQKKLMENKSR